MKSEKQAIRALIRKQVSEMSEASRREQSLQIVERIALSELWRSARIILLYAALPDEPDLSGLFELGWATGKVLALPRYHADADCYRAAVIADSHSLCAGRFGIREPSPSAPELPLKQLDLALVPGVGFDSNGHRLGRGRGFFDRLLKDVTGLKCGVAFDAQYVSSLPREEHDVHVNCLATPSQILAFAPPGAVGR